MSFFKRWTGKKEDQKSAAPAAEVKVEKKLAVKKEELPPVIETATAGGGMVKKPSRAHAVLRRPVVTEKTTYLQSDNKYCFEVFPGANKIEIKKAVEAEFNVHVIAVNLISCRGKQVRFGRIAGQRRNFKKAIVTLKKGEHIEVHQHV